MENEFIRRCWNERTPPDKFSSMVRDTFPNGRDVLVIQLLSICGLSEDTSPMLIQYMASMFSSDVVSTVRCVDLSDKAHINACVYTFIPYGDDLFNVQQIDSEDACRSALKIVEICLKCEQIENTQKAFLALSRSHLLSITIAASRVMCPDKFIEIHDMYAKIQAFPAKCEKAHMQEYFNYALLAEKVGKTMPKGMHDIGTSVLASTVRLWIPTFGPFLFCRIELLYHAYFGTLSNFFANPKIIDAYLLTILLIYIMHMSMQRVKQKQLPKGVLPDIPKSFDLDMFLEVVTAIPDELFFEYGIKKEEHIKIFTSYPAEIDDEHYIDTILEFPVLSSQIIVYLMNKIKTHDTKAISVLSEQILDNIQDFGYLMHQMGSIYEFSSFMIAEITTIYDYDLFYDMWYLHLSIVKTLWRTGSRIDRDSITKSIEGIDHKYHYFLRCFLNVNWTEEDQQEWRSVREVENAMLPLEKCVYFLHYLFGAEEGDFPHIQRLLQKYPFLWVSAFMWAIRSRKEVSLKLCNLKFPPKLLNSCLNDQMLILIGQSSRPQSFDKMDFDDILELHPQLPKNLQQITMQQFSIPPDDNWAFTSLISNVLISWRAWLKLYGVQKLTLSTLSMITKGPLHLVKANANIIFISFAYVLALICDDETHCFMDILVAIKDALNNECDFSKEAQYISSFCTAVILSNYDQWEERLDFTFRLCEESGEDPYKAKARLAFAYSFLKNILYFPMLQKRIPLSLSHIFMEKADWKSVIDLYVIHSQKNEL